MDLQVNPERKETEDYLDLKEQVEEKVTLVLEVTPVPLVLQVLLVFPELKVRRDLKDRLVPVVRRENPV